jgi:hypothetical protein
MAGSDATVARVTVNLPVKVWDALEAAAKADGITRTEALRRAISVDLYFRQQVENGSVIVVERPDGSSERVVFPY